MSRNRIPPLGLAILVLLLGPRDRAAGAPAPAAPVSAAALSGAPLLKAPAEVALGDLTVAGTPPAVDLLVFSDLPAAPKALWSSWGDGCIAADGKYYTAIGNHLDYDAGLGQSRVYAYDPSAKSLKMVVNVRDVVPDTRYAAGKIHARLDQAKDGWIYFATYYGKTPEKGSEQTRASFLGSALLRYDPAGGKTEMLGTPVPRQGIPTSITDTQRMLMYGYAAYTGDFFVYDLARRELRHRGRGEEQAGTRNIMLDRRGRAYFGAADGTLSRYDPETNRVTPTKARLPGSDQPAQADAGAGKRDAAAKAQAGPKQGGQGGWALRASTAASADAIIYGTTHAGTIFAFDTDKETVTALGENWPGGQYTAVMALSPDDRFVYYAPGAHGSGSRIGAPVVQYDVQKKQKKVIAFLGPAAREKLRYTIGGTYNLKLSADGARLFVTFNGAPHAPGARKVETFGQPCVAVIDIPREER